MAHEIKENVMDLNQIAMAQSQPANRFEFDPDALDRAILRVDRRRAYLRGVWLQIVSRLGRSPKNVRTSGKVATPASFR